MVQGPGKLEKFLLKEYSAIAAAHFKSMETISTFFRYYLLIMSIPISAILVILQMGTNRKESVDFVTQYRFPASFILLCVSLIGLMVFCYVLNLRLDVILYARVINGIRKFFYDKSKLDINLKLRTMNLPQSPYLPSYFEKSYFLPVVCVFSTMNTAYFLVAHYIYFRDYVFSVSLELIWTGIVVIGFAIHLGIYWAYARHREYGYLKSNILGIDIDGVINKHREQFCSILLEKTGKELNPDLITIMPVHEHPTLGIKREEERQVFNDPSYWINMPAIEGASEVIERLRNVFRSKIYIFTHRQWPDAKTKEDLLKYKREFFKRCGEFEEPLKGITKDWLKRYGIIYDKIIFEEGNDFSSDPRISYNNRFNWARKKKIRFFVEDDIEKAVKLSYACDIVFLFSQPYNEACRDLSAEINRVREDIPSNVIRVKTWDEIYQHIRRLS